MNIVNTATSGLSFLLDATRLFHLVDAPKKRIPQIANGKLLEIPVYSIFRVPPLNCARYTRLAARDIFHLDYPAGAAWEKKYGTITVASGGDLNLNELARSNTIHPGMLVGLFNDDSHYRNSLDSHGQKVDVTHSALYLGMDEGDALLANQFVAKTFVFPFSKMSSNLHARQVLAPLNWETVKNFSI